MMDIGLTPVPNQTFFVQLEDRAYTFRIHAAGSGTYCVDITRDDVVIVTGSRIMPGWPLLPYAYQEAGNFALVTQDDALPDHTEFGITQFLVYVTEVELAALRAA